MDGDVTIIDPDGANMTGAVVQITGNYRNGRDVPGMAAGYTLPGGVIVVRTLDDELSIPGNFSITWGNERDRHASAQLITITYDGGGRNLHGLFERLPATAIWDTSACL